MNRTKYPLFRLLMFSLIGMLSFNVLLAQHPETDLLYPVNDAPCIDKEAIFRWETNTGAVSYGIQIANSSTFNMPYILTNTSGIASTSFTFDLPDDNTTYYWRVSASFSDNSNIWSEVWTCTTKPESPDIVEPVDDETCLPRAVFLDWDDMTDATQYSVEVYNSSTYTENNLVYNSTMTSSSVTVNVPTYFHEYHWRVSASFTECETVWSQYYQFNTAQEPPTPLLPEDGARGVDLNNSFTWTAETLADSYQFQVATDSDFENIIHNMGGLTSTSYSYTAPAMNNKYYWRVYTHYMGCMSEASEVFDFSTAFVAPTLYSPLDGRECLPMTYTFRWNEVLSANGYHIQIATDDEFEDIVVDMKDIVELFQDITLTDGLTEHYWRVRAEDNSNIGDWSAVRTFTTTVAEAVHLAPANNSAGVRLETIFKWESMADGAIYRLQVSDDETFAETVFDERDLSSTSYTVNLPDYNTDYFWRVSSTFTDCTSPFSEPWKFTTVIQPPVLVSPINNAVNQPFSIFFEWEETPNAVSYELKVSKDEDFSSTYYGMNGILQTAYEVIAFESNTRYYWKVRANNADGTSSWSLPFTFLTSVKGAETPQLVYPSDGAENIPINATFEWSPAARANSYELQVGLYNNFQQGVVINETGITQNTYQHDEDLQHYFRYYWRVRAVNDSGKTKWSNIRYFETAQAAPTDKAVLKSPANNEDSTGVERIYLQWYSVKNAKAYELEVATDANFTSIVIDQDYVGNTQYLIGLDILNWQTDYYWRVKGINDSGEAPWSDTWKFYTGILGSVNDALAAEIGLKVYPTPFNGKSNISFELDQPSNTNIRIYNAAGQLVTTISEGMLGQGPHTFDWNAASAQSGTYYWIVDLDGQIMMKETVLIK